MTEGLVLVACLYGKGCSETYSRYYDSKPSLQNFVSKSEREIEQLVGGNFLTYVAPPIAFLVGTTATSKLNEYLNLKYSRTFVELNFKKEF